MQEHPDYEKGAPLKHLNLANEEPKPGDIAVTAVSFGRFKFLYIMIAQTYSQGLGTDWVQPIARICASQSQAQSDPGFFLL